MITPVLVGVCVIDEVVDVVSEPDTGQQTDPGVSAGPASDRRLGPSRTSSPSRDPIRPSPERLTSRSAV